nr:hypothetical protein CFP56_00646 [Quercus suber]
MTEAESSTSLPPEPHKPLDRSVMQGLTSNVSGGLKHVYRPTVPPGAGAVLRGWLVHIWVGNGARSST